MKKYFSRVNTKVKTVFSGANDQKVRKELQHDAAVKRNQFAFYIVPLALISLGFISYRTFAAETVVRFNPVADTYVAREKPTSNFNTSDNLLVRGAEPARATSYFQFNLSGISGKSIQSAKLRIKSYGEPSQNTGSFYIIPVAPKPYDQLTWYNRPSLSGATKIGTLGAVKVHTWYEVPLSYANWKDGTVHIAFDGGSVWDAASFRSANSSEKPQLLLSYGGIVVSQPKPIVNLTASPSSVASGGVTTLSWQSSHSTACNASGAWSGAKPLSGSFVTGPITSTSTYTLSCTGSGGSSSAATTVTISTLVVSPSPTPTPSPTPIVSARRPFIPWGIWNVNDQNLKNASWVYAVRVVMPTDTTVYRWLANMTIDGVTSNASGAPYTTGSTRTGYGKGNGGIILARLTEVKTDGTPDFSRVIAQETFTPVERYEQSRSVYGAPGRTQLIYVNMNNVRLTAGKMYTMTYKNIHPDPLNNYVSTNSPTVRDAFAGPNGRNNLDPNASGAIAGLDPREVTMWSTNNGSNWGFGHSVGHYFGSGDDDTRLPWYGWQTSPTTKPVSNQPYYAYSARGNFVMRAKNAKRKVTITHAGGYAPIGSQVGVVTVKNATTGAVTRTQASLGEGIVYGALEVPITVDVGQELVLSHSGTVAKIEGDTFIVSTFGVGTGDWSFTTDGHSADVAQLFVLPWPFYR